MNCHPVKNLFLRFAAFCCDDCLMLLVIVITSVSFYPILILPFCPYPLPFLLISTYTLWLPQITAFLFTLALTLFLPQTPGRLMVKTAFASPGIHKALSIGMSVLTLINCLLLTGIFIFSSGVTYANLNEYNESPGASPSTTDLDELALANWQYLTGNNKCIGITASKNYKPGHILTTIDLVEKQSDWAYRDPTNFHSKETLNGKKLARDVNPELALTVKDVLLTGTEYKNWQHNLLTLRVTKLETDLLTNYAEPTTVQNITRKAVILNKLGRSKESIQLLHSLPPDKSDDINTQEAIYNAQTNLGRYSEAAKNCENLIRQTPLSPAWYFKEATLKYSMKEYQEALSLIEMGESKLPFILGEILGTTSQAHRFKALCLLSLHNQQASEREKALAQSIEERGKYFSKMPNYTIPVEENRIVYLAKIIAKFNPGNLKAKQVDPLIYHDLSAKLINKFKMKHPQATEIESELNKAIHAEYDQLYKVNYVYSYSSASPVEALPPKKRNLTKLAAELAKAW